MKKTILLAGAGLCALFGAVVTAQTLNINLPTMTVRVSSADAGPMQYGGGSTLTVEGNVFQLSDIGTMEVTNDEYEPNVVEVIYDGDGARVYVSNNIYPYITSTVSGAHVTIDQSKDVSDKTCGEITYILRGSSTDGSFTQTGSFKSTFELQGLTLTNPSGSPLYIDNGKRIELSAKNGTVNTLTDGGKKGAIYCKGHLELKGKGVLNVTGNSGHAIAAGEYVEMKNLTLNITGGEKDGINCTQYFLMESGTLKISGVEGDGVQVDYKDSTDREAEDTGSVAIEGGNVEMTLTGSAAKGFKTEGDFTVSGGEVTIVNSGAGEWDSSKGKTKAAACVGADGNVSIQGGTLSLTVSGGGAKGISCEGDFVMDGGDLTAVTSGGALVWNGSTLSQNYTGSLDRIQSDWKSSPKGIKCDGDVTINDGTIYVKTTGNNGEGIESKDILTVNGGNITVRAKDDAINSSSNMYIKGGVIDVISTGNDGLDANGNIYIEGGVIMAFGAGAPECGIDANEEQGYTVYITGGTLLAVGGNNSYPQKSGSTQPYVTTSGTITGGSTVSIAGGGSTLYTFTIPEDYTSSGNSGGTRPGGGPGGGPGGWGSGAGGSVMISTPGMVSGQSYTVNIGGTTTNATAKLTGR